MNAPESYFKLLKVSFILALAASLILPGEAKAQDRSCEMARGMALDIYAQVSESVERKEYFDAFQKKDAFWAVAGHSLGCKEVQLVGQALRKSRLGPSDKYAGPYPDEVTTRISGFPGAGGTSSSGSGSAAASGSTGTDTSGMSGTSTTRDTTGTTGTTATGTTGTAGTTR